MFTYLFDGLLRRVFSLLRVDGIYLCISLWLEGIKFLLLSKILSAFFTRSLARDSPPSVHDDLCSKNWFSYSLFPLTEEGGYFYFWDPSQSFGFYILSSPVRRFVWATICPCTPLFTHPVTEYKHLFVSILTWICYLRNWPRFLCQRSVLDLFIQIRWNSSNPLFLFSQWETTYH